MVIGKNQTLVRNNLTGTETTKAYDRILQTGVVYRINFFRRQVQTFFLHIDPVQSFYKHQKPHTFIRSHLGITQNKG